MQQQRNGGGPDPDARRQVDSLLVVTPRHGEQRLDAEPDRRLVLELSSELKLNELLCVDYLITAAEERGQFSCASAAGVYLEERQAAAKCLVQLLGEALQSVLAPSEPPRHPYGQVVHDFVHALLAERQPSSAANQRGPQVLLSRLIDVLKDSGLEPAPGSSLSEVHDEAGIPCSRTLLLQLEQRLLAKALLYCLVLDQRAAPSVVTALLDLTALWATRSRAAGRSDPVQEEVVGLLVLSTSLALTPQEERGSQEREELAALLASQALRDRLFPPGGPPPGAVSGQPGPTPRGPPSPLHPMSSPSSAPAAAAAGAASGASARLDLAPAVLRLSWGVLLGLAGAGPAQLEEARKLLAEAAPSATFTQLKQLLQGTDFKREEALHQEVVACCCYRLLGQALQADSRLDRPMNRALLERSLAVVKRSGGGALTFSPLAPGDPSLHHDHAGSLLGFLATVFSVHPTLWLAPDEAFAGSEAQRHVEGLISRSVMHDAMKVSPELRIPFLDMMAALACGEYGVALVLRQFAEMARVPALEMLTWRRLFLAVVEYCVRYNNLYAEVRRQGPEAGARAKGAVAGARGRGQGPGVRAQGRPGPGEGGGGGGAALLPLRGQEERVMNSYESDIMVSFIALFR
ncbi:hypothetical protein V8C86DRAFT_3124079 [Haematococcus lacustris]